MPISLASVDSQYAFYRTLRHVDVISGTSIRFRPTNTVLTYNASIVYGPDGASASYSTSFKALIMTSTNYAFTTQKNLELTISYYETPYGGNYTPDVLFGSFINGPEYWEQANGRKYVNYTSNPSDTTYDASNLSLFPTTGSPTIYYSDFVNPWTSYSWFDQDNLDLFGDSADALTFASYYAIYVGEVDFTGITSINPSFGVLSLNAPALSDSFTSANTIHIVFVDEFGSNLAYDIKSVVYP